MTTRCLIDTNVLIDYLGGNVSPVFVECVEQALAAGSAVSVITGKWSLTPFLFLFDCLESRP